MGYLVCEKCGGYYELKPGEKPEDFSDKCECGGKLSYTDNDRKNTTPFFVYHLGIFSLPFQRNCYRNCN